MLATISAVSASREPTGSRLTHTIQRPATSFLIRDILGKCNNDSISSDSEDQHDKDILKMSCSDIQDRKYSSNVREESSNIEKKTFTTSVLCCRECVTGCNSNDNQKDNPTLHSFPSRKLFREGREFEPSTRLSAHDAAPAYERRNEKIVAARESAGEDVQHQVKKAMTHKSGISDDDQNYLTSSPSRHSSSPSSPCALGSDRSVDQVHFSNSNSGRADDKRCLSPHKTLPPKANNDLWKSRYEEQSDLSNTNQLFHEQHQHFQQSMISKMKAASIYNQHCFYSGLYAGAQNLIDLNLLSIKAATALSFPYMRSPLLSGFRNAQGSTEHARTTSKSSQKPEINNFDHQRYEPHPRYRLLDWPHGREFPSTGLVRSNSNDFSNSHHFSKDSSLTFSKRSRSERLSSTNQPPSPTFSDQSHSSPIPEKRPLQLPAYFRSRLGGSTSTEESNVGGKVKKCRRSRTVFTELQMLGLEKRFEKQQYLSTPDRVELAEMLGLSQLQVKTWYQNRRMKWKKQVMQGGGTEPPTKPKGRPRKVRPGEQMDVTPTFYDANKNLESSKALDLRASIVGSVKVNGFRSLAS